MSLDDYAAIFAIDAAHRLSLSRQIRTRRADTLHETRWIEERDADDRLIARFRTWTNRCSRAPHRTQFGWERWSLDGQLLDREIRFSTRDSVASLN